MVGWPSVLLSGELGDLAEDVRRLFQELGHRGPRGTSAGECLPPLDVMESDGAVQLLMDLPGVAAADVKILLKGDMVLVVGEKRVSAPHVGAGGFHLVERGSGRFARAVRVAGAFNGALVSATLSGGELRVTLPKIAERRGRGLDIPVVSDAPRET